MDVTDSHTRNNFLHGIEVDIDLQNLLGSVFQIWCKSCKNLEIKKIYSDHKLTVSLLQIILNSTFFQCFWLSFSALTLLVGWQDGLLVCKKLRGIGLLVMLIWLELSTSYSSSCYYSPPPSSLAPMKSRIQTFWYHLTQVHLSVQIGRERVLWHCWLGDRKGVQPVKNPALSVANGCPWRPFWESA